mgnify:CR=1 FL=1|jgi:hypothetical protein
MSREEQCNNYSTVSTYLLLLIHLLLYLMLICFILALTSKSVDRSPTMVHDSLPSVTLAALAKTSVSTLSKEKPFMI